MNHAESSSATSFIVLTEPGILHQMQRRVPEKTLLDVPGVDGCSCNACPYMRLNTLEKLRDCLETLTPAIELEESVRLKALAPIERMLAMSRRTGQSGSIVVISLVVEPHELLNTRFPEAKHP